jgi:hypothetical protein
MAKSRKSKKKPPAPATHGGARPGAGRPRVLVNPCVPTSIVLEQSVLARLDARAARQGVTRAAAVREAVEAWLQLPN